MLQSPILMLPDADVDSRVFEPQRKSFPNMVAVDWLLNREDESLESFADRCVEQWMSRTEPAIDIVQPYLLGGIGLGGVVALEMALNSRLIDRPPTAVLLIGSCRSWEVLPDRFRRRVEFLTKLPRRLSRALLSTSLVSLLANREKMDREFNQLVSRVRQSTSWEVLWNRCQMCFRWHRQAVDIERAAFRVHQIHGRRDQRFPAPYPEAATLVLDGGHWINLSHASAVNNWIDAIVRDQELARSGSKMPTATNPHE